MCFKFPPVVRLLRWTLCDTPRASGVAMISVLQTLSGKFRDFTAKSVHK